MRSISSSSTKQCRRSFLSWSYLFGLKPTATCYIYNYLEQCYLDFEIVYWSEERANRITNAKVGNRLLGVTAVKRSRKSEAEAGEARRGASCTTNDDRSELVHQVF